MIEATTIGICAAELMTTFRSGSIFGVTSAGVFLLVDEEWVVFLTEGREHGPLTINCTDRSKEMRRLRVAERVRIVRFEAKTGDGSNTSQASLHFDRAGVDVHLSQARTWRAPSRPDRLQPLLDRRATLEQTARLALQQLPEGGLGWLLAVLFALPFSGLPTAGAKILIEDVLWLRTILDSPPSAWVQDLPPSIQPFIGRGRGLTPSGDDLILGLLLAFSRWGDRLYPGLALADLNQAILEHMTGAAGALSLSLARCAGRGQAEERLVEAVDGIAGGGTGAAALVDALGGWGSSSGFDAMVGMALVLM